MSPLEALRDALARVVGALEEIAMGDVGAAAQLLGDLETDLAVWLAAQERT
jgi:hypothetical protein